MKRIVFVLAVACCSLSIWPGAIWAVTSETLDVNIRYREVLPNSDSLSRVSCQKQVWTPRETAIIVCDMWDQHWCQGATRRVKELSPRMNRVVSLARNKGVLIIHAPSGTIDHYDNHPARRLARTAPRPGDVHEGIAHWCHWKDDTEKQAGYPIDHADGGCNCTPQCKQDSPWTRQIDSIRIDDDDAISDSGIEIWSLLAQRSIKNIIVMGVHTNMCVLGRPFGLRNLSRFGKNVVLMRDMTDTMYNAHMTPKVSHFTGTDLIVEHIETYVCPTITSTVFTGKPAFQFKNDPRPLVVFISAESEYGSVETLPGFAQDLELHHGLRCEILQGSPERKGSDRHEITDMNLITQADLVVVFARRRAFPADQMTHLKDYLDQGGALIGLRTASHAFDSRGSGPSDHMEWPSFDTDILGGNYHGHHGAGPKCTVTCADQASDHPILAGVTLPLISHGSLYKVRPLARTTTPLLIGAIEGQASEPVAWTNPYHGGRVFYTSLGHSDDFKHAEFRKLLTNAVFWGMNKPVTTQATDQSPVSVKIDWPEFMARQDLIWDTLPTEFDYGAFMGNGMLGSMIYQDGANRLRWEMGRSDVTEHRRDNARLPIGGLVLTTQGKIENGTLHLGLWHAEVTGTINTNKGRITFRTFIHTKEMVLCIDIKTTGDEKDVKVSWDPRACQDFRNAKRFNDPPNPPAVSEIIDGMATCTQPRFAGGQFTTAWKEIPRKQGRRIILSIADSFPQTTSRDDAIQTVRRATDTRFSSLLKSHRHWWHDFYPKSVVSIPDPKLESFYWIQFYKLASASRPDLVPVDLLGPWYRKTGWPRIWWNLNIETLYLPVYTGNRLELGESFTNFIDAKRANFYRNAKDIWGFDNCATVPHTTDYEGLRGDGSCAPDKYINPGDFTWALHNYYLQYRYSMDHSMVTNQSTHAFYPLLRDSINLYLKLLKKGEDGKLHLPVLHSPEYGDDADNNYNLSLLRWGCQTLIDLNQRYHLKDALVPIWTQTLTDLVPYPVDANGLRLGANISITKSHRHWSHILMVHPLHIMTGDQPENRALLNKSVLHWLTVDNNRGINGWSRAAAASLYATLGDGDNAIKQIHGHMADKRFVRPNTMYIEGSPVIECAIVLNRSLQDMLLQSWGNKIAVFPAIPKAWDEAIFHDLRAEGAFLISAERKHGKTAWVRIKSLAGEPCRVQPGLTGKPTLLINGKQGTVLSSEDGIYNLPLTQGDEAFLFTGDTPPPAVIRPIPADPASHNPHGMRQ